MKRMNRLTGMTLAVMLLLMMAFSALAEGVQLDVIACEQQGKAVYIELVCLDEFNAPVSLPLDISEWTVRGATNLVDLQVEEVNKYQGVTHYIFMYEASEAVSDSRALDRSVAGIISCFAHLKPQDCMSIVCLGKNAEVKISRAQDEQAISNELKEIRRTSTGETPMLYDGINHALDLVERRSGERTVVIILSTGMDNNSTLNKYQVAQRLEEERISTYAVLIKHRNNKQDANGLAALCVRGGYLVSAEKTLKSPKMEEELAKLMPAAGNVYTLKASATDASYNYLDGTTLRLFVYQGDRKFSGEARINTNGDFYTVTQEPEAKPTETEFVTAIGEEPSEIPIPTIPASTETAMPTEAPVSVLAIDTATEETGPSAREILKKLIPASGVLFAILAVVIIIGAIRKSKKVKADRLKKAMENNSFAMSLRADQKPAADAVVEKKEPEHNEQSEGKQVENFSFPSTAHVEEKKEQSMTIPKEEVNLKNAGFNIPVQEPVAPLALNGTMDERQLTQQQVDLNVTMDERQLAQQQVDLNVTMDERQLTQQQVDLNVTMDERQLVQQQVDLNATMDERQLANQIAFLEKTSGERKKAGLRIVAEEKKDDIPNGQMQSMEPDRKPEFEQDEVKEDHNRTISDVEKTVIPASIDPQLMLTISDAQGIREVKATLVTGKEITFGREKTDVLLDRDDRSISRNHFTIKMTASNMVVQDHSGNGTYVDNRLLQRAEANLTIGSVIEVGGLDERSPKRMKTVITVKGYYHPGFSW